MSPIHLPVHLFPLAILLGLGSPDRLYDGFDVPAPVGGNIDIYEKAKRGL